MKRLALLSVLIAIAFLAAACSGNDGRSSIWYTIMREDEAIYFEVTDDSSFNGIYLDSGTGKVLCGNELISLPTGFSKTTPGACVGGCGTSPQKEINVAYICLQGQEKIDAEFELLDLKNGD